MAYRQYNFAVKKAMEEPFDRSPSDSGEALEKRVIGFMMKLSFACLMTLVIIVPVRFIFDSFPGRWWWIFEPWVFVGCVRLVRWLDLRQMIKY